MSPGEIRYDLARDRLRRRDRSRELFTTALAVAVLQVSEITATGTASIVRSFAGRVLRGHSGEAGASGAGSGYDSEKPCRRWLLRVTL